MAKTNSRIKSRTNGAKKQAQAQTVKRGDTALEKQKWTIPSIWKETWAWIGPLITLLGFWAYWSPTLTITAGAALSSIDPLQTEFIVSNSGHVPVYDIAFECGILPSTKEVPFVMFKYMARVETLQPQELVSKGCFERTDFSSAVLLKVTVYYTWPIIGKRSNAFAFFTTRHGDKGNFLVAEATPKRDFVPALRNSSPGPL